MVMSARNIMMVFPTIMLWLLPQALSAENIVFPSDAGVVNVKQSPYFAYGDGINDDTAAIQQALNSYPSGNRIIYLPNGTYLVSSTLTWPAASSGATHKRTILQGQSRDGTIIKLKNACPGYQDLGNLKAVIWTGLAPAQRFRNAIRNLTVNTGSGNPAACGIQFNCSNQGGIRDVKIISEDGQGIYGLDMSYTDEIGPMLIRNLHVVGFYYGIRTYHTVNSMTLEHITLEGQRSYGFINGGQVVSIRGLTSYNSVTAVRNDSGSSCMVLIDANLVGTGGAFSLPAIVNTATLYARNITTSGYLKAIENTGGNGKDVDGQTVTEFVSHDIISLFPSGQTSLNLPVKEVPTVPWDDLSDWVNPERYGAKGNDTLDDTAAFQAAIDSGKTTVYIPAGRTFYIQGTLRIRGNVRHIIGTEGRLQGNGTIIFEDGTYPTVVFERFDAIYANPVIKHAASRTLVLSTATIDGGIIGTGSGDFFLDDVCAGPFIFSNPRQRIWARQIDPEQGDVTNIDNQGAMLWILGLKTERGNIKVNTTSGGYTEVLGAHIYSTSVAKVDPILCIDNASASFAGIRETNYNNLPYNEYVKEIRYTNYPPSPEYQIVRVLTRFEAPGGGAGSGRVIPLYVGYVSYEGCDLNHDYVVDLYDFAIFAPAWMSSHGDENWNPLCDISKQADYVVNASDLAAFAENWLTFPGVVAYWPLDEMEGNIAYDIAGDHDGTVNGGPIWRPAGGKVSGALEFDGVDDYISTGFVLDPAIGAFSVFVWTKGGAPGQVIISQTKGTGYGIWLGADSSQGRFLTGLTNSFFFTPPLVSEFVITDGDWHKVGVVWDGARRHLYVDGAEVANDSKSLFRLLPSDGGLHIGAGKTLDAAEFWSGLIDDIRIYDHALNNDEVKGLSN